MALELLKEKWSNSINTLKIGGTAKEGGTRTSSVTVGGVTCLPFMLSEGVMPHKPVVAMEIFDTAPTDWADTVREPFKDVCDDPAKWAKKCVEEYKAELLCLKLQGTHPDFGNRAAEDVAGVVKSVLGAVGVPLIILGTGDEDKDNAVLAKASEAAKGEMCLLGDATEKNYKTLTASCHADGHSIIGESPIDINIAKQVNILISDMGFPAERIAINPTIGALGYGMEYAYSIMERARLAALNGDRMLSMPFVCFVGQEAWRANEAKGPESEHKEGGPESNRGPMWEYITAVSMLQAGADILIMRHPKAVEETKKYITKLLGA